MSTQDHPEQFVEVHNVRITPAKLVLRNMGDTQDVVGKFAIQNVGKKMILVRITAPTVNECLLDTIVRGQQLSPGLQIIRVVKFMQGYTPNLICSVPIYINEERYDYQIEIDVFEESVTIYPLSIDLGRIQLGAMFTAPSIFVTNGGNDKVFYYTEVGKSSTAIFITEPQKSIIPPFTTLEVAVKVISFKEIQIVTTLHVKVGGKFKGIRVTGEVIPSKLESIHKNCTEHFTFIEFPATYFGLKSYENLALRNRSILRNLFSTLGEEYGTLFALDGSTKNDSNADFSSFNVNPEDGIFEPHETKLFQFTFTPHPRRGGKNTKDEFFFCTILIKKFRGHLLELNKSSSQFFDSHTEMDEHFSSSRVIPSGVTFCGITESVIRSRSAELFNNLSKTPEEDYIRVYLYGTAEYPSVNVIPDELLDFVIPYKDKLTRVLELKNNSTILPIIIHYQKIASVNIKPASFFLKPQESLQVLVDITPKCLGKIKSTVVFHLLYHDNSNEGIVLHKIGKVMVPISVDVLAPTAFARRPELNPGLTPNYVKEVGKNCEGVRFSTNIQNMKCITVYNCNVIDQNCKDLVAFPNDMQRSLRPCRLQETCRTLFTRNPRYLSPIDPRYELTQFGQLLKKGVSQYYNSYMRSVFARSHQVVRDSEYALTDYSVTDNRKNFCNDMRCVKESIRKEVFKTPSCIPLTPMELERIVVNPVLVNTGQIVVNDTCPFSIYIRNNNNFTVRIFVKTDKKHISSVDGNRYILGEMNETTINFLCRFSYLGHNNSTIQFVVNESMSIPIPVFAEVVNKYLQLSTYDIHLSDGNNPLYVDLTNNLGVPISFEWTLSNSDFTITPMVGTVRANRSISCAVRYIHGMNTKTECDAYLQSSTESVELVALTAKFKKTPLTVPEEGVHFKDLSLNISRLQTVIIRNPNEIPLTFKITHNDFDGFITVSPECGVVEKYCTSALFITAKFTNCVVFDGHVQFETQSEIINMHVYGNVVYPSVEIIPNVLNIPKICGSSSTRIPFVIKNTSPSPVMIRFMMSEFEMFIISTGVSLSKKQEVEQFYLESKSSQRFFLHFIPSGAMAFYLYLPIVLNDIIGPPIYNDMVSTKVCYYLIECIDKSTVVRTPIYVPCVKIHSLSLPQKIDFNKTAIRMKTVPKRHHDVFALRIHNPQLEQEGVCLRIDDVKYPFEIDYSDSNIIRTECSIICHLQPDESVTLKIYFKPDKFAFGSYGTVIPIYIRSDHSTDPHRYLTVDGIYRKPGITMKMNNDLDSKKAHQSDAYINYLPMTPPLKTIPLVSIKMLTFRNHLDNCEIKINCMLTGDELTVNVDYDSKEIIGDDVYTIQLIMTWTPKSEKVFCWNWKITCTCGGFWEQMGCRIVESCFLTMPAFSARLYKLYMMGQVDQNINASSDTVYPQYPFWRSKDEETNLLLETSISVMESWLQSQIFSGEYYYLIPNDICHVEYGPVPEHLQNRQVRVTMCHLAQILITLAGPKVFAHLGLRDGTFSDDLTDVDKIIYLQNVYLKFINFVAQKGGSFSYLQPEYLLSYNLYKVYKERIYNQTKPPFEIIQYVNEFADFISLSKRSWFDTLLQTYKVFVVNRIYNDFKKKKSGQKVSQSDSTSSLTPMEKFDSFEHVNKNPLFLSESESFILNWTEYIFNNYKDEVWNESLEYRQVGLFDDSLKDGVVFATITLAYCPYMKPFLKNIYLDAGSYEEIFHNTVFIIRCWRALNFSFRLYSKIMVSSHCLGLLMQLVYLYDTLPFMYPIDEIVFDAPLSKHIKRQVILTNTNSYPIAYKPILISEDGCFKTNEEIFEIPPKKSKKISVYYFAKFCKVVKGTLLFSGEIFGYRYAKNKCLTLVGNPDLSYATTVIKYPAHLYTLPDFQFKIKSPYQEAAKYNLRVTMDHMSIEEVPNVLFYHERHRLSCSRLMLTNDSFDFDESGLCVLTGYIIPIASFNTVAWLYFTNKTVGDFAVKIIMIIKECLEYELLTVNIPADFNQKRKSHLKKKLYVEIPHRNKALWNTIRSMLFRITSGDEKLFWNRIIDTPIGTNVLQRIMIISAPKGKESNAFDCSSDEYDVRIPHIHHNAISLPHVLTFPDECSPTTLKVPIIVKDEKAIPDQTLVHLHCAKLFRKRTYMIYFDKNAIQTSKDSP